MTFKKKIGLSDVNNKRMYKLILDSIPNEWKHMAPLN